MKKDKTIMIFSQFTREEFADWLWRGLQSFYSSQPSERDSAFDYVGYFINQQESVFDGIARVYKEFIIESKQLMFRQAIGDVLREQANNQSAPLPAFQDLIYLIAKIRDQESLNAILPTIGNGFISKKYPDILYETLATLRLLAPSNHAFNTASELIDCVNFNEGYLFEAIKVLAECEPSNISAIILKLEPRINQLRQSVFELDQDEKIAFYDAANDCVRHLLKFGTITWIKDFWENASHSIDQIWLFELLFDNEDIPINLIYEEKNDSYYIDYKSKRVSLVVSEKSYRTLKNIIKKSSLNEILQWTSDPDDIVNTIKMPIIPTSVHTKKPDSITLGAQIYNRVKTLFTGPSTISGYTPV